MRARPALAAVRAGGEVSLVERSGCFGGNITAVGVEGMADQVIRQERATVSGALCASGERPIGLTTTFPANTGYPRYLAACRTWQPAATQRGAGHRNDAGRRP